MEKGQKKTVDGGNRYEETHINNVEVYAPDAGKVENNHAHTVNVQVNIKFSFHIHLPFALRLFDMLSPSFLFLFPLYDVAARGALLYDWRKSDESTHQLSGSSAEIASFLRRVYRELGADSVASIRYICKEKSVDCSNLTLHQAIKKAEHESGL